MKETIQQQRLKKIAGLKEELTQWQQIVVNQQIRIDRLECTVSALITTLNRQGRFATFDMKVLDAEMDRIVKARRESAKTQANGHDHKDDSISHPA
jgi:hypothetical protein